MASALEVAGYREYAINAANSAGIPVDIFTNLIGVESGWNPNAVGPTLANGENAIGIAQIRPSAHPWVNPTDPYASLDYAAQYLREQFDKFGNWAQAVAAYNAGPATIERAGGIPSNLTSYVNKVLSGTNPNATPGVMTGVLGGSSSTAGAPASAFGAGAGAQVGYFVAFIMIVLAALAISQVGIFDKRTSLPRATFKES